MRTCFKFAAVAATVTFAFPAVAQQAAEGNWLIRGRAVSLDFHNGQADNLQQNAQSKIEAKDRWIPEVDVSYFFTKNIAAELALSFPQSIDLRDSNGKLGSFKAMPVTLLAQYHFTDLGAFKPYVGAGVNYTSFSKRNMSQIDGVVSVDSDSWGLAAQAGFDYALSKNWSVNVDLKYVRMNTDVKWQNNTGGSVEKLGKLELDPWMFGVGVGYRF